MGDRRLAVGARVPVIERALAVPDGPDKAIANPASREGTVSFWVSQGAPKHVAEGIADRVNAESGFNPSVPGDAGTSGGLYQHHADRLARLQVFAAAHGVPWTNPAVQHQFSLHEVKGGDSIAAAHWAEILNAPDRATASKLWDRYFERSGSSSGGGTISSGGGVAAAIGSRKGIVVGGLGEDDQAPDARTRRRLTSAFAPEVAEPETVPAAPPPVAQPQAAAVPHLSPIPLPPAPNLAQAYRDAISAILSGHRRPLSGIFG